MLRYRKKTESDEAVSYDYTVENTSSPVGTVTLDKRTGVFEISEASNDEHAYYAQHLVLLMRDFEKSGEYRDVGEMFWY
ncbi:hypothetical protein [Olsenella phocaeensis]|uniref:hypothetical protein n=1 Tax=Olsenella phocaeensis TaxID=1852385 RepID=UPI0009312972|nr:hypothetical protein [Olsenella phocaeensis]